MKLFGGRALNTMRLEKSFGSWAREYRPIYGPYEAGLGRFVDLRKERFIGRAAALEEKDSGGKLRLLTFTVDARDADAFGDEPIWHDGEVIGWVTSGGYGHSVERSLALGYVPKAYAELTSAVRDRDSRRALQGHPLRRRRCSIRTAAACAARR